MKKILVATDFSDAARNAVRYAAGLAQEFNASLHLLHVFLEPAPALDVPVAWSDTVEAEQKEKAAQLREEADNLAASFPVPVTTDVIMGFTGESIADQADKQGADLVVVGMKGGKHSRFWGSNAITAIRKVSRPVLVVPEETAFKQPRRIVFSTDFKETVNYQALDPLVLLAKKFGARIEIVHVQEEAEEMDTGEIAGKMGLERAFEGIEHQFATIVDDDVEEGIQSFTQNNPTDMLVMVAHHHGLLNRWLGTSHTKQMSYQTTVPLLVLHDRK
ncbi:MAG TPA: universal stress protein [Chitinophagaceae bacterium]